MRRHLPNFLRHSPSIRDVGMNPKIEVDRIHTWKESERLASCIAARFIVHRLREPVGGKHRAKLRLAVERNNFLCGVQLLLEDVPSAIYVTVLWMGTNAKVHRVDNLLRKKRIERLI